MTYRKAVLFAGGALVTAGLALSGWQGAVAQGNAQTAPTSSAEAGACSSLMSLKNARGDLEITSAKEIAPTAGGQESVDLTAGTKSGAALPAYCKVEGILNRRKGSDGHEYGIRFAVALPENWNGRFLFQGGGGLNGVVRPPLGTQATGDMPALARGFAVASTDSGHQGAVFDFTFTRNQQAMLDFAYNALGRVTHTAKNVIASHYGKRPDHSYFVGCSTGGREGMVAAQRFAFDYDGVVVGAPAMRTGHSNQAVVHAQVAFNQAAHEMRMDLDQVGSLFSAAQRQALQTELLAQCDAKDGLKDGLVFASKQCRFDPSKLLCEPGENSASCLKQPQIDAIKSAFAAPETSSGRALYAAHPWDPASFGETVGELPGFLPSNAPTPLGPPTKDLTFDGEKALISANADQGARLMDSYNYTNLNSFTGRGGKMLMYHGTADPWFSAYDTVNWWENVAQAAGGTEQALGFDRLFLVPGMGHCHGGALTPDTFDLLTPLVEWVEQGKAPQSVPATGPGLDGAERKLCPYPSVSTYDGKGDPAKASSYSCKS
ncbi:tannase/feruloyl esterase family alpha/beta hydrolase [Altericroceibacterium spongiae]|uniref:Tannase/feruloyl esterase family alpha/beta hydrolase n=1 Tax=Altericroceibacterium spongiae TaxID=2320269 RepID=A0A420EQX1_9SPHN|nr:tannase/feruloyl esterase family alpha/beta hydrolase [Altericroceibacterium spongiae]RKF23061.1 tannase/feruloyl esterase family alpha/beta hydrolase [Altericroceibacterium spongiae]